MRKAFDFASPPFDRLRPAEAERVRAAVDVAFFRRGHVVLRRGDLPDFFYIVVKGVVEERDGEEVVGLHEAEDAFDSGILIHQACRHDFVVREEAICHLLPIEDFLDLTANNTAFAGFFFKDLSHKLDALAQRRASPESPGSLTLRVGQAPLQPPVRVPAATTLHEAAVEMEERGQRALLVEAEGRTGIVTGVDLTRAAVRDRRPLETPVGEVAHFDLVAVDEDDLLMEAALLMSRHAIRHLVVRRDGQVSGILDAANALGSLATQSDLIGRQIARATSVDELEEASERVTRLVMQLHETGTKVSLITGLASQLNADIAARLWQLIAPAELQAGSCLIVMGSEGRGEQVLKTDQDNGLILRDGLEVADLAGITARFTDAMIQCGFPACPGEVMVRNPAWSKPLAAWKEELGRWARSATGQVLMDVAIFVDAAPVTGDAGLLAAAKEHFFRAVAGHGIFLAHFARAIDSFGSPLGMLGNIRVEKGAHKDAFDLKKGGIFPIVHGVRALALERRLTETNTVRRVRRLVEQGSLDRAFGNELIDAFHALLGLRLQARIEKLRLHQPPDNFLRPGDLSKLERDVLKESLAIVKRLQELVRRHFQLAMF
ncbi:MAG TPA: putative nucleotidyltransferase substrate binding domain-containing protein [Geminicoccaceae bacterium]|nr:putative nucleotidyltransferase substrate binding domain-containing protein [Geminicoccaceae bacterium]